MIGVHPAASVELAAAAALYDRADASVRKAMGAAARGHVGQVRREVARHARTRLDRAMTESVRVTVSTRGLAVTMGTTGTLRGGSRRAGGVRKRDLVRQVEFGANRERVRTYTGRSPTGRRYRVTRHTTRQLPAHTPDGRLLYAAVPTLAPQLMGAYVRAVADLFDPDRTRYG